MHIRLLIGIATVIAFAFLVFHLLFGKDSIPEQRRIVKEIELYQKEIDSLTKVIEQRDELIQKLKTDSCPGEFHERCSPWGIVTKSRT